MKNKRSRIKAPGGQRHKLTPCLWYDSNAKEAVDFYTSLFADSKVFDIAYYGETGPGKKGSIMTMRFQLEGQEFLALNGGPYYHFTPAVSFMIDCGSQKEVDFFWDRLAAGGQIQQCGWVTDKFGLCWQVVPRRLLELTQDKDADKSKRVMEAMLQMKKLDIAGLEAAAKTTPSGKRARKK